MGTYLYSIYSLTAQTIESNVYDSFRDLSHAFSGMGCLFNLIEYVDLQSDECSTGGDIFKSVTG